MLTKTSMFVLIVASLQIAFSYGYASQDEAAQRICEAPAAAGEGSERLRRLDVSTGQSFLSGSINKLPVFCMGNGLVYNFETEEPSDDDEVMNAAREKIGETSPEAVEAAKQKLVELLKKDTTINAPLDNSEWLVRFLRLRNYDVNATYQLIKNYYNFKAQNKKLYDGLRPTTESEFIGTNVFEVLPKRDQYGSRMVVAVVKNWDPKKFSLVDVLKAGIIVSEIGAYEPATQISGVQMIIDMNGMTTAQMRALTPSMLKKLIDYSVRYSTNKNAGVHFVNESRFLQPLYNMMKPFLSKELKSKMFFHGNDMESLHKHFSADLLPETYGGSYPFPSFTPAEWNAFLATFDQEFEKINSYGIQKN